MDLKEVEKRTRLRWGRQATIILQQLPDDFPIEAFEDWVEKNMFVVGGSYLITFLEERAKIVGNDIKTLIGK